MKYGKILLGTVCAALLLANNGDCSGSGDAARDRQADAIDAMSDQADRKIGMPAITNFQQKAFVRDIYERTDRATTTYAYTQGLDGTLICLGQGIGYGVPYGTRSTPPEDRYGMLEFAVAQPEPNGLYLPDNAEATWWQMLNPETGKIEVVYLEPTIVITPFKLRGPAVEKGC